MCIPENFKSMIIASTLKYLEYFENYLELNEESKANQEGEIRHDWKDFYGNLKRYQDEFHIEIEKVRFLGEDETVQRQTLEYLRSIFVKESE